MNKKLNQNTFKKEIKVLCFDFDGVFTDNRVYVNENGEESVACYRSDGIGISRLVNEGIKVFVISTEKNPVVSKRCEKLRIKCYQGVNNKVETISEIADQLSLSLNQFAFVGNDINDLGALRSVGFSIAVADSYPEVLEVCDYICKQKGGFGAVREVCDMFVNREENETHI